MSVKFNPLHLLCNSNFDVIYLKVSLYTLNQWAFRRLHVFTLRHVIGSRDCLDMFLLVKAELIEGIINSINSGQSSNCGTSFITNQGYIHHDSVLFLVYWRFMTQSYVLAVEFTIISPLFDDSERIKKRNEFISRAKKFG